MQADGGTQECTYIGENEHTDGSKTMYGVWTDPDPAPGDPATPYYVALYILFLIDEEKLLMSYTTEFIYIQIR